MGKNGVVEKVEENGQTSVTVGSQILSVSSAALVLRFSESEKSSKEDTENVANKTFLESLVESQGNSFSLINYALFLINLIIDSSF